MRTVWKTVTVYGLLVLVMLICVKTGSKAVTTLSENSSARRKHCIVIDPGHGGEDGGAVSCSGLPESTYNLEIALRLNDLMNLLGYDTKMTRTTDISIYTKGETLAQKKASDLKERVRIINETDGALLLSIHQNKFPDERYRGAQVFYADSEDSKRIAEQLQVAFMENENIKSERKAKKCEDVYLMKHIYCPGVLIECGFLSNVSDEAKLRSPEYQKELSSVIAVTIGQYLSNT